MPSNNKPWSDKAVTAMQKERLAHFKEILLAQLNEHSEHIRDDQAAGLELSDDGVKDSSDLSVMDVNQELAFRLGDRESQMVADIDQALLRIKEGTLRHLRALRETYRRTPS